MYNDRSLFTDHSPMGLFEPLDLSLLPDDKTALSIEGLNLHYGQTQALFDINMRIAKGQVTAFIGPSGCGKSTLLSCINRMNDLIDGCHIDGKVMLHGQNVYDNNVDVAALRRRVGMVFQRPNPFPKSIYENVVYGLRLQGISDRRVLDDTVENSLRSAALWDEVKGRLHENAFGLSGGQQQRLVIARAIAIEPEILLLDEPTSALDPISTLTIEELINDLKAKYTVIIVTHNMQQAARVSDQTAFMHMGELVEYTSTNDIFTTPKEKRTEDYITGRYG
ncbi:phosphate ABC transporter ATP-binding protein [Photobacterium kishitanii]|uniref:Phosphate ABC transporter ATP-binding protein n=2 Tax=Photobacterium kishitanii TaxID=318456 RepID=A0A2T3QUD2_9GAMM|nr:phosphate ABC transporter ATP-binding protein PstB [Photobacterium kishitanii]KJG08918.1 phosphate ABC transporter ATP-binding protein [Photobacterium kishitanii]KJG56410.1 phosphate ABC transporter ATP-binding protein [Photobacterium kishitanii]KJG60273.1 phosphate ABC transporter ATP-binding protein [Photobacterium kishitanii]KJG64528.1 phosphate ABC transporter ATP-binding protein [Photobacterium kishitanii]KJG68711.1 phosphate ABC transporter ATP-binding protein [Photobacterium kishitan